MKATLLMFILSISIHLGVSVKCFDCNSANNTMCLDPAKYDKESVRKNLPVKDCKLGAFNKQRDFFCRKIVQTSIHKRRDAEVRVTRGCGRVRHQKECVTVENEDHLETVCQCFTDLCNAAHYLTYSAAVMLAGLAGSVLTMGTFL